MTTTVQKRICLPSRSQTKGRNNRQVVRN